MYKHNCTSHHLSPPLGNDTNLKLMGKKTQITYSGQQVVKYYLGFIFQVAFAKPNWTELLLNWNWAEAMEKDEGEKKKSQYQGRSAINVPRKQPPTYLWKGARATMKCKIIFHLQKHFSGTKVGKVDDWGPLQSFSIKEAEQLRLHKQTNRKTVFAETKILLKIFDNESGLHLKGTKIIQNWQKN